MAQGISGAPVALEVHVTGRRVLATIVDGVVIAVPVTLVAVLFGAVSAEGGQAGASLTAGRSPGRRAAPCLRPGRGPQARRPARGDVR